MTGITAWPIGEPLPVGFIRVRAESGRIVPCPLTYLLGRYFVRL